MRTNCSKSLESTLTAAESPQWRSGHLVQCPSQGPYTAMHASRNCDPPACLQIKGVADVEITSFIMCRLRLWLEDVLWEGGAARGEVYRLKGVVEVEGSMRLHIVQAVRELYDIVEGPEKAEDDVLQARLVLIGRDLQKENLTDSFQSMVAAVSRGVQNGDL